MNKFTNRNMLLALACLTENGENVLYPLYGGLGRQALSASSNTFGYAAVTDRNRLIYVRYNVLGMNVDYGSYFLENIVSLKISKLMKLHTIKAKFNVDGKTKKFWFQANEVVHGADFMCQGINLPLFISTLEKFKD